MTGREIFYGGGFLPRISTYSAGGWLTTRYGFFITHLAENESPSGSENPWKICDRCVFWALNHVVLLKLRLAFDHVMESTF
jgi:hypothetical protein